MKTKNLTKLFFLMFALAAFTTNAQFKQSQWQKHLGKGKIKFDTKKLGDPSAYSIAKIPAIDDPEWVEEEGKIKINLQNSTVVPFKEVDFTYFQTVVTIPKGTVITDFTISFDKIDDGARAYIFNSKHNNGSYKLGSDFILRESIGKVITNFADYVVSGEDNRIVIVQFDNHMVGNSIEKIDLKINGISQTISNKKIKNFSVAKPISIIDAPDVTSKNNWTIGWGNSGGEHFNKFDREGYFKNYKQVKRFYHYDYYWSAAQNTTDEKWVYKEQSITFPPKSSGAVALHPGPQRNQYAKVRYTAKEKGTYNFDVSFKYLDAQFDKAKAEVWTNSNRNWVKKEEIILTKDMYNQNGGTIDKNYSIYLEVGEMISIELENGGIFNNDFTQVTLSAEKKAEFIPDMSQVSKNWAYGYGGMGKSFTEFGASQNYAKNSTVKIRKKGNQQYYSASQNTSEIAWTDTGNNITFPPKSKGAIALHPGSGINDYAKVRYTAPQDGDYEIRLIFKHLDTDFSRAKAEIWTNNKNNTWHELDEISLTKLLYDDNNGVIERAFTISLKKGEKLSVDIEADGGHQNDYTLVTFGVNLLKN